MISVAVPMVERLARLRPTSTVARQARTEALVLWTKYLIDRGEPAVGSDRSAVGRDLGMQLVRELGEGEAELTQARDEVL